MVNSMLLTYFQQIYLIIIMYKNIAFAVVFFFLYYFTVQIFLNLYILRTTSHFKNGFRLIIKSKLEKSYECDL